MDVLLDGFHSLAPWGFAAALIGAALSDARGYVIPNRYSALIAVLYPLYALSGSDPAALVGAAAVGFAVLVVAIGLFAGNVIGGGDAKLVAATALWAGPAQIAPFLLVTSLAGGALSLIVLVRWRIAGAAARAAAARDRAVPYGIAIASGGLYVAALNLGL